MTENLVCKWKNTDRYCWSTRYGCIDCDDYEPIYQKPEVCEWVKPFIDNLNSVLNSWVL